MGWRHKKAGTAEVKELRTAALMARGKKAGLKTAPLAADHLQMEPALPPLLKPRLSWRQVGYFRGRKIFETSLSLLYLQ